MARSTSSRVALVLLSAGLLLASCGGNAEDRKKFAAFEQTTTDELAKLRAAVAEAKLNPNNKVHIVLDGSGASTKISGVDHQEKKACKDPEPDCARQVKWILQGGIPQDWYVQIAEKASSPDKGCFATPKMTKEQRSGLSGEPAESCRYDGAVWGYSVTLYDKDGATKSVLDPLIVVNWGP